MNELLTLNQISNEIGVSRKTLWIWRKDKNFPVVWANDGIYVFLYDLSSVKRWMQQNNKNLKK